MASSAISASAAVYDSLRHSILTCELRPGDVLDRRALADRYAVSQMPVREALMQLDREGFVAVRPRSKTVVAPIEVLAVFEAAFLRRALLVDVVRRLARGPDRHELGPVRTLAKTEAGEQVFCAALCAALGMEGVWDAVLPLLMPLERCAALAAHPKPSARSYCDILGRIDAADPKGAVLAMEAHLAADLSGFAALRAAHPVMFGEE